MGDLHSIAYNNNLHSFSSLGCDFHGLEVFNNDISPFVESTPPFLSNFDCDLSSGYLQDALFKFNSKRRRLLLFDEEEEKEKEKEKENYQNNNSIKNLWSSTLMDQQFSEDYDSFSQITKCDSFSGNSNS
ncbi:unnamed protein product [Withania somnifera]